MTVVSLYSVMAVWLGGVFVLAGVLKLVSPRALQAAIVRQLPRLRGYSGILVPALSLGEIILGVFLILGIKPLVTALLAALCLVAFTAFALRFGFHGESGCACFGRLDGNQGGPLLFAIRNSLLIGAAVLVAVAYRTTADARQTLRWDYHAIVLGVLLLLVSVGVYLFALQAYQNRRDLNVQR